MGAERKNAPATMLKFEGTPLEIGGQIWERMCLPAVRTASNVGSPIDLARLYAGFVMAAMGSMTADFGHDQAEDFIRQMSSEFSKMKTSSEMQGTMTQ